MLFRSREEHLELAPPEPRARVEKFGTYWRVIQQGPGDSTQGFSDEGVANAVAAYLNAHPEASL